MTEHDKDKLIDKLKKILALTRSPNENEAALAADMAQELLARHNLTMADVNLDAGEKDDLADIVTNQEIVTASHPWRRSLGVDVAEMYFCKYLFYTPHGKNRHVFVGARQNVAVATLMFMYLLTAVERLAQEGSRGVPEKEKSPYRTSFRTSCTTRLGERIRERVRQAKAGTAVSRTTGTTLPALINLYDRAAQLNADFIASQFGKVRSVSSAMKNLHQKGYSDGYAAGNSIGLDQQVAGRESTRRLTK